VLGHDGTIGVESTAHDGTTFTLHLPRHRSDDRPRGIERGRRRGVADQT
jgi:light-regulated signal transduction histidine kinase (bacteriophytochrome)